MSHATHESQGSTIAVLDSASPAVYQTIANIANISGLRSGQANEIDTSNLASTFREFQMGLADLGTVTFSGQYSRADTNGQEVLKTAWENRTKKTFRISTADSPAKTFTFDGYVLSAPITINLDDVWQVEFTVRLTPPYTEA